MVRARGVGKYRHKLTIQRDAGSRDAGGGLTSSWVTFAIVWARQFSSSAGAAFKAGKDAQDRVTVWECKEWIAGTLSGMRVLWNDRYFRITGVSDESDGNEQRMFLQTTEMPAGAV